MFPILVSLTFYDGFYHICGTILESPRLYIKTDEQHTQLDRNAIVALTADYGFYFTDRCGLVDEDYPTPVIQLEIQGNIPWVLNEPNPYLSPGP